MTTGARSFGQVPRKSLIGAAISEAHGVLGLVQHRGLRQDNVSTEEKMLIERNLNSRHLLRGHWRACHRLAGPWTSDPEAEVRTDGDDQGQSTNLGLNI